MNEPRQDITQEQAEYRMEHGCRSTPATHTASAAVPCWCGSWGRRPHSNPQRKCGMCAHADQVQEDIETLVDAFHGGDIDRLREAAHGCPACMLAAVLEWRKRGGPGMAEEYGMYVDWRYEQEKEAFWQSVTEARQQAEYDRWGDLMCF